MQDFPDLVLSDIMMPKRDGLELCTMIKNDIRVGHIPVILMTARSMVVHIKEGFQAGADDYIVKPGSIWMCCRHASAPVDFKGAIEETVWETFLTGSDGNRGKVGRRTFLPETV